MNKPLDPKVGSIQLPGIDGSKIGSRDFSRPKDPVQCDPEAIFLPMKKKTVVVRFLRFGKCGQILLEDQGKTVCVFFSEIFKQLHSYMIILGF